MDCDAPLSTLHDFWVLHSPLCSHYGSFTNCRKDGAGGSKRLTVQEGRGNFLGQPNSLKVRGQKQLKEVGSQVSRSQSSAFLSCISLFLLVNPQENPPFLLKALTVSPLVFHHMIFFNCVILLFNVLSSSCWGRLQI